MVSNLLVVVLLIFNLFVVNADFVIPPVSNSQGPSKLLVIFQGAAVPAVDYITLAQVIQTKLAPFISLYVGIPSFPLNYADPLVSYSKVESVFAIAQSYGFPGTIPDDTYLSGHSLGGVVARVTAQSNDFAGLILFGSYLSIDGDDDLFQHKGAVLTLAGELDGLTRVTRMAVEYAQYLGVVDAQGQNFAIRNKPVIILPSVTHSQFCNTTVKGDLLPEIPLKQAQDMIGTIVQAFLTVQVSNSSVAVNNAFGVLSAAISKTADISAPFLKAQTVEQQTWCIQSQTLVANLQGSVKSLLKISEVVHDGIIDFAESKPELSNDTSNRNVVNVQTSNYNTYPWNPFDISTNPVSATQVYCKMKSQKVIVAALNTNSFGTEATCKDVNVQAQALAISLVSATSLARYKSKGIQLKFVDDSMYSTGVTWLASSLQFGPSSDGTYSVGSSALYTDPDAPFGLGGMHYCVLLSPAKVVEWILVDSLPKASN